MRYTPKKSSEILRAARRLIEQRKSKYICFAISYLHSCDDLDSQGNYARLRQRLIAALHPFSTYEEWLRAYHPEFARKHLYGGGSAMHGRLQWLDHLIAEYEANDD